mmetsp:Transcript_91458/g.217954  ORF Transcript_91458/g.217954 Transcript_91458/m.217954 type:complete len:209 (-) Transcript_91458:84-710(-)|eukprot:CAMPEP_0181430992 /NCGR_PEP_ID=MMETSP1110-20121109/18013_1 /TAXON_ID=174948 /ORGANISM="Symbiodinium sp., Strain CCMP421" /LENGTH=208 /DNA_ID=CAMNT_0023554333 /DNA_START=49 /DNA_END=675 /DNA_ORIENTATION=+
MGAVNSDCVCVAGDDADALDDLERSTVFINIYDLNKDWPTANSVGANLFHVGGAFHAAVEVYGLEWSYGCEGVERGEPRRHDVHVYRQSLSQGVTMKSVQQVEEIVEEVMKSRWLAHEYDLLRHNCCSFADDFCRELTGRPLPPWVNRLPRLLSNVDLVSPKLSRSVSRATANFHLSDGENSARNDDESPKFGLDVYPSVRTDTTTRS